MAYCTLVSFTFWSQMVQPRAHAEGLRLDTPARTLLEICEMMQAYLGFTANSFITMAITGCSTRLATCTVIMPHRCSSCCLLASLALAITGISKSYSSSSTAQDWPAGDQRRKTITVFKIALYRSSDLCTGRGEVSWADLNERQSLSWWTSICIFQRDKLSWQRGAQSILARESSGTHCFRSQGVSCPSDVFFIVFYHWLSISGSLHNAIFTKFAERRCGKMQSLCYPCTPVLSRQHSSTASHLHIQVTSLRLEINIFRCTLGLLIDCLLVLCVTGDLRSPEQLVANEVASVARYGSVQWRCTIVSGDDLWGNKWTGAQDDNWRLSWNGLWRNSCQQFWRHQELHYQKHQEAKRGTQDQLWRGVVYCHVLQLWLGSLNATIYSNLWDWRLQPLQCLRGPTAQLPKVPEEIIQNCSSLVKSA